MCDEDNDFFYEDGYASGYYDGFEDAKHEFKEIVEDDESECIGNIISLIKNNHDRQHVASDYPARWDRCYATICREAQEILL